MSKSVEQASSVSFENLAHALRCSVSEPAACRYRAGSHEHGHARVVRGAGQGHGEKSPALQGLSEGVAARTATSGTTVELISPKCVARPPVAAPRARDVDLATRLENSASEACNCSRTIRAAGAAVSASIKSCLLSTMVPVR